jgi:hypothetical protein
MAKHKEKNKQRVLDARPDTVDFRDKMYEATLVEVPPRIDLDDYKAVEVPILDQGTEGACTGFGLGTVANYLLRTRQVDRDTTQVSPRMLYEMAKRYDEWPGEEYEGSSARGAMKGWHKHGACSEELWPYVLTGDDQRLTDTRAVDAASRPLGAYYRVKHKDLVAMHSALAEVGILYATVIVHEGWTFIGTDGVIPLRDKVLGGHALAIVAYDERGFWIQNSWGEDWGRGGFALLTYDDWLVHGTDVWAARLGAPVSLHTARATATSHSAESGQAEGYTFRDLRPHIISIGNDGGLRARGTYGTSKDDVEEIFKEDFPRITSRWKKKRLFLYAHGGLVDEVSAIQRVADYRTALLQAEVYPLAFIWKTDVWTTLTNILQDAARRRRPEGFLDESKDFLWDRLDDTVETLIRLPGKALWDEMKENALLATNEEQGGARIVLEYLEELLRESPSTEVHVVGHSAGSIFHAPIIKLLTGDGSEGFGRRINSVTLWAPAITVKLFKETCLPAIQNGRINRFALFTLTDEAEQDDHCAHIYHKSLLYLVSNAFEDLQHIPLLQDGEPILGMQMFVQNDRTLKTLFRDNPTAEWVISPNIEPQGSMQHSTARRRGDFDDDIPTLRATLARIVRKKPRVQFAINRSASSQRDRRQRLGW